MARCDPFWAVAKHRDPLSYERNLLCVRSPPFSGPWSHSGLSPLAPAIWRHPVLPYPAMSRRATLAICPRRRVGVLGRVAIRTSGGFFVTAIGGGGGPTEPNCSPYWVALHQNATRIGPWETFKLVRVPTTVTGSREYAFQTSDGDYITAVNGGGIGDQNGTNPSSQLITNATRIGAQEEFRIVPVDTADRGEVAIQTPDGKHFVTAVNGGGCGGPDSVPFHSNAKAIGPNESFTLIKGAVHV